MNGRKYKVVARFKNGGCFWSYDDAPWLEFMMQLLDDGTIKSFKVSTK